MDTVKKILKMWWNFNMKIGCFIPIVGSFTQKLIIASTPKEKASKEAYRGIADTSYDFLSDAINNSIESSQARQREIEARERQRIQEEQDYFRKKAYQKMGVKNVQFNSDGTRVKLDGSDWLKKSDVEKKIY